MASKKGEADFGALTAMLDVYAAERKRGAPPSPWFDEMAARARAGTLHALVVDQAGRCKTTK